MYGIMLPGQVGVPYIAIVGTVSVMTEYLYAA